MGKLLPSPRTLIYGTLIAFLAIYLSNNVGAINRLVGPRS